MANDQTIIDDPDPAPVVIDRPIRRLRLVHPWLKPRPVERLSPMTFIIAYDIADPRRLRKTAQHLERYALRVQKSVFIFDGTYADLRNILNGLLDVIDVHLDRVQAWPITETTALNRIDLGTTLPARPLCVIVGQATTLVLEQSI